MAKYPVVVYGASGYTGMLIMDWLIDQNIPFTAVARNAKRTQEMMVERVVRLESATYEILEVEHNVESLTQAFKGAKVVCNTVGPFVSFGAATMEAALKAGCHYLDTTGEQAHILAAREQFGELYRQAGLVLSPSMSYMYTFSEIAVELTCRIANGLLADGLPSQTKGAVWALNDVTAWACTLGQWRANMTWIPVGARNAAEENHYLLDAFDCEVLFFQEYFAEVIAEMQPHLPKIKLWICIDGDAKAVPGAIPLHSWIAEQPTSAPNVAVDLDDVVALMPTGGTTGAPKGVMNTHRSLQTWCAHMLISCAYNSAEHPVNLAAAPITHTAGILTLPCTAQDGTVVVVTKPDPVLILGAVAKHQVTEFFLPPTVIYKLLGIPGIDQVDFSSVKYLMYGAAPMSVNKLKKAIELWGPIMAGGYGQTEAPASIANLPPSHHFINGQLAPDERLSSVGRPDPLIRVEMMNDDQQILSRGETGEICVRGDLVMRGYYKQPQKPSSTAGCTPAMSAISTPKATCISPTARRT
ncbi:AMP-binding protein [Pseudomonas paeninsulae]|uniref:AMP-binding protein n=1 Tax=Pseudomonas paeninsulae TaxID=3110772 RepID=UPI002D78683D|nr:AMP-binding protein [Pseudomonas sp. IT1137]